MGPKKKTEGRWFLRRHNIAVRVKTQRPVPFAADALAKRQMQNISAADGFSPLSVKKVTWGGERERGIIASKQYKPLLRAAALINYAVFCNVNARKC